MMSSLRRFGEPSYQTGRLQEYDPRFLAVAEDLFVRVCSEVPAEQTERHLGSYSIHAKTSKETAAKIVIYDPQIGHSTRNWPPMRDGVYVWIRANGPIGDAIWGGSLPTGPKLRSFQRMWRDVTVQVSANPQADFAYFPIMAGDDLNEIKDLVVACSGF
jgi:hypothetical protein